MYFKPQSRNIVLLCAFLFSINFTLSQTTIWSEDFSSYPDGETVGVAGKWSTTTSGSTDWFEVRSNIYEGKDLDGENTFTTENIDISSFTNVNLSVDISESGPMEDADYINIFYQIDTGSGFGAEIQFATNGNNITDFGSRVASQTGLNGQSVRIIIRVDNDRNDEIHRFDNILVEGIPSAPPTITSLGSTSGCEGTSITINGTNLTGATAANVTIGGTPVTSITSNTGTTIVAVIGAGTTGTVAVNTPSGTAISAATFTVNLSSTVNVGAAMAAICQGGISAALGGSVGGGATGGIWSTAAGGTFNPSATTLNATWTPPAGYTGTATLRLTTSGGSCGTVFQEKNIVVSPATIAGTASSNQTICGGTSPADITLVGFVGSIQWQVSTDNSVFNDISGATSSTLTSAQMGSLSATQYYRAEVTSGGCSTLNSNTITITVNPTPTLTSTTPGSRTGTGTVDISATSSDGSTISWYDSISGGVLVGTSASGANFTTPSISSTTIYYAQVSNGACDSPRTAVVASVGNPEINLVGLGNNIGDGDAGTDTANGTDFGSVSIPGTVTRTFTIENTGSGPLLLTGSPLVEISGSTDFTVTAQPISNTISAGGSLTFEITYNPTVTGTAIAIVSIDNNDIDENVYDFAISGAAVVTGIEIDIQGNEVSIVDGDNTPSVTDQTDFGITDATTPISIVFTVHSFGSGSLTLNSTISITGTNASMFSTTTALPTTLNPAAVTSFEITFTPTAVLGVKTATITITSDDPDEGTYNFDIQAEVLTLPAITVAPGGITSNLKFWLKADSNIGSLTDNTSINTWQDQTFGSTKSAISNFAKEPKFQNNPSYNVNFNPVIHFDGNNSMYGGQGFNNSEMFIVVKPTNSVTYTTSPMDIYCGDDITVNKGSQDVTGFEMGNTSARHSNELVAYNQASEFTYGIAEVSTTKSYSGVNIFNARKNATYPAVKMDMLNNGNFLTTSTVFDSTYQDIVNSRYWLGRSEYWSASYDGDILEIINYDIRNSDTDRRKIESYLAIKYGITLGTNGISLDYLDSDGNLIWDVNSGVPVEDVFNYDIAGIGRDDVSGLNQKQSKTENTADDITIGHGDILTTNNLNSNNFSADKSYLVWGNNRGTLAAQPAITVDMSSSIGGLSTTVDFTAIGRTWKVVKKGTVGVSKISIPETMLSATLSPPGDYLMFISDSPTFSPTSEYRIMSLNGSNLETQYEFTGSKKYITFGYAPERNYVRSIQFDGASDYLDAGNVLDLNPAGFTISAWIKRNNTNASIVSKRDNGYTTGYDFKINNAGNLEMSWNGGVEVINSSIAIPVGIWHHVAVIYDGTNAQLYIDGVEDVTQTAAKNAPVTNAESFLIAAADGNELNTTSFFNGNIDEVRVWDTALTEDELRFVMNQEIETSGLNVEGSYFKLNGIVPTKYDISDGSIDWSNLKGYYPMSTYTFTNCKDASGNGNTAAIKNLTTVDYQTAPLPYVSDANGPWDTAATWLNNTVQNLPNSVSIIDGVTHIDWNIVEINHDISVKTNTDLGREREVLALIVNSNELTIDGDNAAGTGNALTITHYLKLDGLLDLQGESQLIQTVDSDFDATSTGSIERDQQGEGNLFRYNYWSSPVYSANDGTNYTTLESSLRDGSFADDGTYPRAINFVNGYNGSVGPPIALSTYWMFKYANKSGAYSEWVHVGKSGTIYSGEGFTMKGAGNPGSPDQNYVFVGKPNNGVINLNVAADNNYLVGNPYPSALDADQFILDNAATITGSLYFWEHYGGDSHNLKDYQGGYAAYSLGGGLPAASAHPDVSQTYPGVGSLKTPGRYIPIGQSFYVVGEIVDGGIIEFNNGQRIFRKEGVGSSVFMKNSSTKSKMASVESLDKRPKFRIGFDAPKIGHRQILLTIDEKTTDGIDWGYEAEIYQMFEDDMYWVIDDAKYIIQATNTISLDKEIPLGIQTKEGGAISINVDALENVPENTFIYIKDTTTGETYDITNQAFEVTLEAGDYNNRFVIAFQPRLKTLEEVSLIEGVHIFMNNTISELQVRKIVDTEIINASLFNLLGQQVKTWNIESNERLISLPLKIATGVYIVRVNTSTGMLTKKIIIE